MSSANRSVLSQEDLEHRREWLDDISRGSGNFGAAVDRLENKIAGEINAAGVPPLLNHLRLCGAIPERYGRDSSEEKLYSKYTDIVIHRAFTAIGLSSNVLSERADSADVECACPEYEFVADAKAFRLSRTAKNQKDFKVQAMDSWKRGRPYATVVCPAYQLPSRASQIYQQAASRNVFVSTYTHLCALVRLANVRGTDLALASLHQLFRAVETMNPSKNAVAYWQTVNRTLLDADATLSSIWREEKIATVKSILMSKEEALRFLQEARMRIMRMSKQEAVTELLRASKLDKRVTKVKSVKPNGLLDIT